MTSVPNYKAISRHAKDSFECDSKTPKSINKFQYIIFPIGYNYLHKNIPDLRVFKFKLGRFFVGDIELPLYASIILGKEILKWHVAKLLASITNNGLRYSKS